MHRGYIKLWRKTLDSGIIKNGDLCRFWVWCLLKATHKECVQLVGYQQVSLMPGQFVFGRLKASQDVGMSQRTVRTCVQSLSNMGNLTIKSTNKYSIISITNWANYQSDESQSDQQVDQQTTSKRPANDQQTTTNKNINNIKNNNIAGTEVPTNGNCPYEKIVDLYHSTLPELPSVRLLTEKRKGYLKARWAQKFALKDGTKSNSLEFWGKYFNYIRGSTFLMGQVDPQPGRQRFSADLEWITNSSNFTKILEGKYHK